MASSTSSVAANSVEAQWKHDVFLSFRGEDTRHGFTGYLYEDLVRKDLKVYRDDEKLQVGTIIRPELLRAIEESKSAIVILSENYAGSTWCLDELAKIVECVETRGLILFPVFYGVDPSDVRRQRNKFDLAKYETNSGIAKHIVFSWMRAFHKAGNSGIANDRVDSWRRALHKVGHTAGLHVKGDRYEIDDRDEIVRKICQQLDDTLPIGLDEKMRNLESQIRLLICRENDVKGELGALEMQQPGRKRKREVVVNWLEHMDMAKTELESLQQEVRDVRFYSFSRGQLGKRVKMLTEQVESLNQESNFPDGITIDAYEARGVPFPTTDIVLGETFRMNCEEVLGYLKNDEVSSIGIYGIGGVGKTTVMRYVHNQVLADPTTFGNICWVTVSQNFNIVRLQNDIFRKLNHDLPSEDDEMSRAASLFDILKTKGKHILILDDVWVNIPLEKVGIPIGVSLCKVIVTTRSLDVCNKMVCQQKIKISPLLQEEAWGLFMEKLGPHEELTSEVIQIAKHVARRCGGLPLAIITMAASMRGVSDIHEWRDALEELEKPETFTINGIKSEVLPALKYSYDHLGDEEWQLCFLSCALYPEDFEIPRYELIDYCIVKGLIKKRESRRAEIDRGHTILNKLVKCCLLEYVTPSIHKSVKMHDLIREMALQIMSRKQKVMVKAGYRLSEITKEEEWTEDLEVVSLINNVIIREIPNGRSPRCPKLSTLMLQQNDGLTRIPDSFFVQMCGLRVLSLCHSLDLRVFPDSVGDLINLNALWLRGCRRLQHFPSLRKLKELRDLDLSKTAVKEIPDGIGELRSLRCLNMSNSKYQCAMDELKELQQLEVFQGQVRDASDCNVLVRSELFQQLWAYCLLVGGEWKDWDDFDYHGSGDNKKIILRGLNLGDGVVELPAGGIKRLTIDRCHSMGKCLLEFGLSWEDGRTTELKQIQIISCKEIEWLVAIPPSSSAEYYYDVQLPSLEELSIGKMENMKGIFNWWDYFDSTTSTTIPITIPSRGGGGSCSSGGAYNQSSFSRLKQLYISDCNKMKVGLTVNCLVRLPVLETLGISECSGMEEIIRGGACEERENNNGISISTNISLPKLNKLSLQDLPSLRSVYNKGNIICDSIQVIELFHCTGLKRLPITTTTSYSDGSPRCPFPSLGNICILRSEEKWWESLELVHHTYHPLLQPFLHISSVWEE